MAIAQATGRTRIEATLGTRIRRTRCGRHDLKAVADAGRVVACVAWRGSNAGSFVVDRLII
jgi:hypothetical protein